VQIQIYVIFEMVKGSAKYEVVVIDMPEILKLPAEDSYDNI
jgi:hypothetical protein